MAECFYCEKDNEKRKALMLDVCELPYSIVYLFRDQKNKGRCVWPSRATRPSTSS